MIRDELSSARDVEHHHRRLRHANLEWRSINRTGKTLRVQSNERWDFKVKDEEQRDVPLSEYLLERLLAYRQQVPKHHLVFGKLGGSVDQPDGHLLRRLKTIVRMPNSIASAVQAAWRAKSVKSGISTSSGQLTSPHSTGTDSTFGQ